VLVVNHASDVRTEPNTVGTHDYASYPALQRHSLKDVMCHEMYKAASVIIVDESQFFPDLDLVMAMVEVHNKIVIVGALSGDYQRQPFKNVTELLPHADRIEHLTAICSICRDGHTPGIFTRRTVQSNERIVVGGEDKYIAVCRRHYLGKLACDQK